MDNIRVLQLGEENWIETWSDICPLPEFIDWEYREQIADLKGETFDLVFLDRNLYPEEVEPLFWAVRAYCLFVTDRVVCSQATLQSLAERKGRVISCEHIGQFLAQDARNFYSAKRAREKQYLKELGIAQGFRGAVQWRGVYELVLSGDYGEHYTPLVFWRNSVPVPSGSSVDVWLEYEKDPEISVQLHVKQFAKGEAAALQQQWVIDEAQMQEVLCLQNTLASGELFFSLMGRGSGTLRLRNLHARTSRRGYGHFLPGGERFSTEKGEELFCYFDPGDLKPPLTVFFADRGDGEGFDGYSLMRKWGGPFLLISESRLESGAGYLGSGDYENQIMCAIRAYMKELGFMPQDVVFSGISMGAFGALYYGCEVAPHAILAGKPLADLGDVAMNERLQRPNGFPMSLELLKLHTGRLDADAAASFNQRFWEKFQTSDWSNTQFYICYMLEDDYDAKAYERLLEHLASDEVQVFGKGIHGRHRDNDMEVMKWFENQYQKLLEREYGRKK